LGDPPHGVNLEKVQKAAELGGASSFIEILPEKYDTYLERPVQDHYSAQPQDMTNLFGRPVDFKRLRNAIGGISSSPDGSGGVAGNRGISGGQMQRIALWVILLLRFTQVMGQIYSLQIKNFYALCRL